MSNSAFTPSTLTVPPSIGSARLLLADGSNPSTSSTSQVDLTGVTTSITLYKSSRIGFALLTSVRNNTAGQATRINIQVNSVNQLGSRGVYIDQDTNSYFKPVCLTGVSEVLAAGTYTVKARWDVTGGTATILADSSNSTMLSAWEI